MTSDTNGAALVEVMPGRRSGRFRLAIRALTAACEGFGDKRPGSWLAANSKPEVDVIA